ncbi:NAD-dependent epimerase/dehydratase family protein [Polynucleobacter paneuropaeus]|nr:NAD-dependent epimerase/dehydratase family protein [Polynucleobacter paneuropaeus]
MKTLLIIGGTGFFGKSFLDCYKRGLLAGWGITKVLIMSRNVERIKIENPELLDSSIQLLAGDIGKINSLPNADYVIHAAASTDARSYLGQPDIEKRNIQAATYNYSMLAETAHFKSKILYVSSGAVYGPQLSGLQFLSETYELDGLEGFPDGKRNYAFAKRDAECAIYELGKKNLNVAIARCFAFVGPWLPRDQHFAIGNFIQDGLMGRPIAVKATSPVYRSYMYADDLVHWLMTICHSASPLCPIYNVGSDQSVSIGGLAELIAQKFSVDINKAEISQKNIDRYVPSISKAKELLGLQLSTDLATAIDKTIEAICIKKIHA